MPLNPAVPDSDGVIAVVERFLFKYPGAGTKHLSQTISHRIVMFLFDLATHPVIILSAGQVSHVNSTCLFLHMGIQRLQVFAIAIEPPSAVIHP